MNITAKACKWADKQVGKGADMQDVAFAMMRAGIEMIRDGSGNRFAEAIVRIDYDHNQGIPKIEIPMPGQTARIIPDTPENTPVRHDSAVSGAPVPLDAAAYDAALQIRAMMTDACEWMAIPDDRTGHFHEGLDQHLATIEKFFAAGGTPDLSTWILRKANHARAIGHSDIGAALEALVAEMGHGLEEQPIDLENALRLFYADCHARNVKAGWWTDLSNDSPKKRSVGELFMLIVTELAEAYDAYVNGSQDDKLPEHPGIGVELGDVQIRVADFCGALLAGRIVENSGVGNPGDAMFELIGRIARDYEAIRKTDAAKGEPELGEPLEPMDVAKMTFEKLAFNATRKDHTIEARMGADGKRT